MGRVKSSRFRVGLRFSRGVVGRGDDGHPQLLCARDKVGGCVCFGGGGMHVRAHARREFPFLGGERFVRPRVRHTGLLVYGGEVGVRVCARAL